MINVLYSGNYKVFDGLLLSVLSMVKHTDEPLNIMCLTMDLRELNKKYVPISPEQEKYMQKVVKDKNKESNFKLIDVTKIFKENLINSVNIKNQWTPYAMLRLLCFKLDMPEKFIYLDTDTLVNRDIKLLNDIDIEGYELGVVKDAYNWSDVKRWRINKYFNSGVLLVNMKECLKTGLFEKATIMARDRKMLYTDQDALNLSITKKKMLPLIYNSKNKYYKEIVVHHFCDVRESRVFFISKKWWHRIKPWEVDFVKKQMSAYDDILDDYLARKKDPKFPIVTIE